MTNFVAIAVAAGVVQPHRLNRRAPNARRAGFMSQEELNLAIRLSDGEVITF